MFDIAFKRDINIGRWDTGNLYPENDLGTEVVPYFLNRVQNCEV